MKRHNYSTTLYSSKEIERSVKDFEVHCRPFRTEIMEETVILISPALLHMLFLILCCDVGDTSHLSTPAIVKYSHSLAFCIYKNSRIFVFSCLDHAAVKSFQPQVWL